ncbi:DUF1885 family protein [Brevibacillus massiliensis]|uniref:DUF1885 family protein n=1 Tax=Brevibacillus massiliensis TaxID=1118054 RepID=UPI0002F033C4|nr:DUF1885 family protein [Brevibacillus massiliensis]
MNLQSAYIYLVEGSAVQQATLADVKQKLQHYIDMTKKTGQQLGWWYSEAAFPYTIEDAEDENGAWLLLKGQDPKLYRSIIIGVGKKAVQDGERHYIQVTLPPVATHGDKSKANEFCRFLARAFKGELVLFNGRVQYFQPRKP